MKSTIYLLAIALMFSCAEETAKIETQSEIDLKALEFDGNQEIFDYNELQSSENRNSGARLASGDFESFNDVYYQALEELDSAETVDEHNRILEKYSDVVVVVDDTYVPRIENLLYRTICNRQGIYISAGLIHKVMDNETIVFTEKSNAAALLNLSQSSTIDPDKFTVVKYQGNADHAGGRIAVACNNPQKAVYTDDENGCKDDRRVYTSVYSYFAISGNSYSPAALSQVYSERKSGVFCNWKLYDTRLEHRNVSFSVTYQINGITNTVTKNPPDYIGSSNVYGYESWDGSLGIIPIVWAGGLTPQIYTSSAHQEGTSRGVGSSNFAIIDCQ